LLELCLQFVGDDDPETEGGPLKSIQTSQLTYKMLKAIQELSAKVTALENA
jgi:hypothetical protein